MQYEDDYIEPPRRSFLSQIGSFLWSAIKILAVAALVATGIVLFNDKAANWVDSHTGGAEKGAATWMRNKFKPVKDTFKEKTEDVYNFTRNSLGFGDKEPKENKTEKATEGKADAMIYSGAAVGTLVGVRSLPAAGQALGQTVSKIGNITGTGTLVPQILKDGAGQIADGVRSGKDGFKALFSSSEKAAELVGAARGGSAVIADAVPLAAKSTQTFAQIGAQFGSKVAPFLKAGSRVLGPVGGTITVAMSAQHASDLNKEGKTGSAVAEGLSGAIEGGSMASMNPLAMLIGTAVKDWTSVGDMIITGKNNVMPSGLASIVKEVDGVVGEPLGKTGDGIGHAVNWMNGRTDAQIAEKVAKNDAIANRHVTDTLALLTDSDRARFSEIRENLKYHDNFQSNTQVLLELQKERYPQGFGQIYPEGYSYLKGFADDTPAPAHGLSVAANLIDKEKQK